MRATFALSCVLAIAALGCGDDEGVSFLEPCERGDAGYGARGDCKAGYECRTRCTLRCETHADCEHPLRESSCHAFVRDQASEGNPDNAWGYCVEGEPLL